MITNRSAETQRGFSLVEMLVVIAIIGVLSVVAIPGFQYITRSSNLTSVSGFLRDGLGLARQTAITKNSTVEVRIYQLPASGSTVPSDYRAFQVFLKGTQTIPTYTAVTPITYFPQPIILSTDATKTSLLNLTYSNSGNQTVSQPVAGASPPSGALPVSLPTCGTSYNYLYFCYTPSGGTTLDPSQQWFATLVPKNAPIVNNGLPANFVTVQIDPVMGGVRVFRP